MFDFLSRFVRLSAAASKKARAHKVGKAGKVHRRKLCFEPLESRELLSATPDQDLLSPPEPLLDATGTYESASMEPNADAGDTPIIANAISNSWGTVLTQRTESDSWDYHLFNQVSNKSGSFTFTLARSGDANSFIELYAFMSGGGRVKGNTSLTLDGDTTKINGGNDINSGTIRISLDGKSAGEHTVSWYVHATGYGTMEYSITIKPTPTPVTPPVIATQPVVSTTYNIQGGGATALSVSVIRNGYSGPLGIGSSSLTVQWQSSTTGLDGSWSNVGTASIYVGAGSDVTKAYTPSIDTVGTMFYRCRATNTRNGYTASDVYSDSARIDVIGLPVITAQPVSATYLQGEVPSGLSVGATKASNDPGTLSYQWYRSGVAISGATSATLNGSYLSTSTVGQTGYYCEVTNSLNGKSTTPIASTSATISVIGTPSVTQQGGGTYLRGETATPFSVTITKQTNDPGTLFYEWQYRATNDSTWSNVGMPSMVSGSSFTSTFTPSTNNANGTTFYRCVVTNKSNGKEIVITTDPIAISLIAAPIITAQPVSAVYIQGEATTPLSIVATKASNDPGTLSYQWQSSDNGFTWGNVTNQTATTLAVASSTVGTTYYRCIVTNKLDGKETSTNSGSATISVIGIPSITAQPVLGTYLQGETPTALSVVATKASNDPGTLLYQWYKNGVAISGATSATLAAASISTSAAGQTQYYCKVTNSLGGKTPNRDSDIITISVIDKPIITAQPVSAAYWKDDPLAALSVTATRPANLGNLTYQWFQKVYYGEEAKDWKEITGATAATLPEALMSKAAGQQTDYYCLVTNSLNGKSVSIQSNIVTVAIEETNQRHNTLDTAYNLGVIDTVFGDDNAPYYGIFINEHATMADDYYAFTFNRTGDADSSVSIEFDHSISNLDLYLYGPSGTIIATSTRMSGNKEEISFAGLPAGTYKIRIENYGSKTNTYRLIISPSGSPTQPVLSEQPVDATYKQGEAVTALSVTATANGAISYQWQESNNGETGWTPIAGEASKARVYDPTTNAVGTKYYRCVVTNTLNGSPLATHSDTVKVIVIGTPVITTQPVPATYLQGEVPTVLSVTATKPADLGNLTYQWYKNGAAITGATSAVLNALSIATSAAGETQYYCTVTNSLAGKVLSTNSVSVTISVIGTPSVTTQPVSATYIQGTAVTALFVAATKAGTDPGVLSYQWQSSATGNSWSNVTGQTATAYSPPTSPAGTMLYRCIVTNKLNGKETSANSASATIAVIGVPSITGQPVSETYIQGDVATALSVAAQKAINDPGVLSYQWQSSSTGINGSWSNVTGQTATTLAVSTNAVGTLYYRCVVTNKYSDKEVSANSSSATIGVIGKPSVTGQPVSATYWQNDTAAVLSVAATMPANLGELSYQWYKNGVAVTGATAKDLAASFISTGAAGQTLYSCRITNTWNGKKTQVDSASATVAVIGITEQLQSGTYAYGEKVTLAVTMAGSDQAGVTVKYLWQKYYPSSGGSWGPLMQGSSRTYTLPTNSVDTEQYRCVIEVTLNGVTKQFTSGTATITIKAEKLIFDEVAKDYIYETGHTEDNPNTPQNEGLTQYAGWTVDTIFGDNENYLGLYAEGLKNSSGEALLVFRGTDIGFGSLSSSINTALDWIANMDGKGIGYSQYMAAQSALINWAKNTTSAVGTSLSVIGHSLGGALAQWFAADFTSQGYKLAGVETFNATGIAKSTSNTVRVAASSFNAANCGYVAHHVTSGDIVSMFGDEFISGTAYIYTASGTSLMAKHTAYLADMSLQKTITASALSSGFFHYDGEFLSTINSLSRITPSLQTVAPLLFFRCTAEGVRSSLGKFALDQALLVSSNRISVSKVPLGGWTLKDVEIAWNNGGFLVSAGLQTAPKAPIFGVTLVFVDYAPYINNITAYMDASGKGEQIGITPLYLQHIDATVGNIANPANLYFAGNAEFTIGQKTLGQSLVTINGSIDVNSDRLAIGGSIVAINDWFFNATGNLTYNWSQNYLQGAVNAKLLGGLANFDAVMKIWNNNGVSTLVMAGDARVQIPNNVWLIGGWGVNAGVGVYVTANNNNSDDYVLVATSFNFFTRDSKWKWSWKNDIGVKFYFDGRWDVIGASLKNLQALKDLARSEMYAGAMAIGGQENPNLLVLDWGHTNENPLITFKLSDGRILTEAEMIDNGYITLADELCSDTRRVYGVLEFSDLDIALWEYTLDGDANAITPELWGMEDNLNVSANSISGGNGQPYQFDVNVASGESNASSDTVLTFYLSDSNERDFNGVPVWTTTLGELQSSGWVLPDDLAPGVYSLYCVAEEGNKVPAKAYFAETISIGMLDVSGNLRVTSIGKTAIQIEWNKVTDATEYVLQRKGPSDSDFVTVYTGADAKFVDANCAVDTTYQYRVQALGESNRMSAASAALSVKTRAATAADVPMVLWAEFSADNKSATVVWGDLGASYRYQVYRNGVLLTPTAISANFLVDTNPAAANRYIIVGYDVNAPVRNQSMPFVLTSNSIVPEIANHTVANGKITLNWDLSGISNVQAVRVYRNGILLLNTASAVTVTDQNPSLSPRNNYEYILYVVYQEEGKSVTTFSSTYAIPQSGMTSSASSLSLLDSIWSDLDFVEELSLV